MKVETAQAIAEATRDRRSVVLVRNLTSGEDQLLYAPTSDEATTRAFQSGKSASVEVGGETVFLRPYLPGIRLAIVGAVHIAQPLAQFGQSLGYQVEVIDPRGLYASPERFPAIDLIDQWPDDAFLSRPLDESTALVCLSHDEKLDDPALTAALSATRRPAYIGALGSRRTHAKRVERLLEAGFAQSEIDLIKAPIGLKISAVSPAEIATAIAAEVIQTFRTR